VGKDPITDLLASIAGTSFDNQFDVVSAYLRRLPAKECLDFFKHPAASAWMDANVKAINEKARIPVSHGGPKP